MPKQYEGRETNPPFSEFEERRRVLEAGLASLSGKIPVEDSLEIAEMKRRKLQLRDRIAANRSRLEEAASVTPPAAPPRTPGRLGGRFTVGPDFFEPMSPEELRAFGGE